MTKSIALLGYPFFWDVTLSH